MSCISFLQQRPHNLLYFLCKGDCLNFPVCPVKTTLLLIGDKRKVLILRDLMGGTKRFGELRRSVGHVSQKVLTAQLRDMEPKGLVNRRVYAEVLPRVEYTLTETGYSLRPINVCFSSRHGSPSSAFPSPVWRHAAFRALRRLILFAPPA